MPQPLIIPLGSTYVAACLSWDKSCLNKLVSAAGGREKAVVYTPLESYSGKEARCEEPLALILAKTLEPETIVIDACGSPFVLSPRFRRRSLAIVEPLRGSWARSPREAASFYNKRDIRGEVLFSGLLKGIPPTYVKVQGYTLNILRSGIVKTEEIERLVVREVFRYEHERLQHNRDHI